ncbi:methylenetetrahydrofolate reductase (NADPH) [Anabrus simplex]|uniref:methylenetetrahydrofolate reductase (NADPH) n=1 Tax=Anabrus simplex TaxID=316456 RepID=UPI0035A2C33C
MPGTANDLIPHVFDLASSMHNNEILLHIAATGLTKKAILDISSAAVALGIRNFFALRGDRKWDMENDDFPHAVHLVQFLRKHFGRNIVICVAGYPGGHPESPSYEDDLKYLKEKVDAGVDFIITQILYEARAFEHFVDDCRNIGITVPIIAGIMPIKDYASLQSISKLCHLKVPKAILETLEPIRHNDDLVQSYGISYITDMAKQILSSKRASGIHFFTMNRSVQSGFWDFNLITGGSRKALNKSEFLCAKDFFSN